MSQSGEHTVKQLLQKLQDYRETGDQNAQADIHTQLCEHFRANDQIDPALEHAGQALILYEKSSNHNGQGIILNDMGSLFLEKQDYEQALRYFSRSMQAYERVKNIEGMANTRFNMAVLSLTLKKIREAVLGLLESQFVFLDLGEKDGFHKAADLLGEIQNVLDKDEYKIFVKQCSTTIMREGIIWGELEVLSSDRIKDMITKLQKLADADR